MKILSLISLVLIIISLLNFFCFVLFGVNIKKIISLIHTKELYSYIKKSRLKSGDMIYIKIDKEYIPVEVETNYKFIKKVHTSQKFFNLYLYSDKKVYKKLLNLSYMDFVLKEDIPPTYKLLYMKEGK